MKLYFYALLMCQSMFCAIPAPQVWEEKAQDKMLLFLPVIGLEIGALWALLAWLCQRFQLSARVAGLLLCVCPYLLTGLLHLDGYMDVVDALQSWRSLERRREILKDSHVGSFAVIYVCLLILAQFAFFSCAPAQADFRILLFIPAVSRCCSAIAVSALPPMTTSQYAGRHLSKAHLLVWGATMLVLLILGFLLCGKYVTTLLCCIAGYALALIRGYRSLEGMNGDLAGFSLTIGELCAVAAYALI